MASLIAYKIIFCLGPEENETRNRKNHSTHRSSSRTTKDGHEDDDEDRHELYECGVTAGLQKRNKKLLIRKTRFNVMCLKKMMI